MKIIADENITMVSEYFSRHGEVITLPGRKITATTVKDADVLLVRSVTSVDKKLLAESRVRFVGSCTIGIDHLDISWLDQQGIHWANAPGCNANAVVDYVLASLFALDVDFSTITVGIVGCGNVGSRLVKRLEKMHVKTMQCDPFKEKKSKLKKYVSLDKLISHSDVVCLHAPLTKTGEYPTFHLVNEFNLPLFKQNAVLLNAGRGAVIDNQALLSHLQSKPLFRTVLDVWENEPAILKPLLEKTIIATPHIAGYSVEGKLRGTEMVYEAFCKYFSISNTNTVAVENEDPLVFDNRQFASLRDLVLACYNPVNDSGELKNSPAAFDRFRRFYLYRREFSRCRVLNTSREERKKLKAIGF